MRALAIILAAIVATAVLVWNTVFFTVDQTQTAIVVQFGEPQRVVSEPGLDAKWPFVEEVVYFDKRILDLTAPTEEVTSSDQKRLVVDAFARYRINDPLLFYQSVGSIGIANNRLAAILNSSLRSVLAGQPFQAVLSGQRANLMVRIRDIVNTEGKALGIEVVDVRIRRADLPEANSQAIFGRMRTERQREAADFRAQGSEIGQGIRSRADRDVTVLLAEAERDAAILRGEGDGEAARIYAEAYGRNPDFFEFYRSMRAYEQAMASSTTTLVIDPSSEFFKYLKRGPTGVR